jgi:hypothetical protein
MPDTADIAGWKQDPTGDHKYRFHDGTAFTRHVSDDLVGLGAGDLSYTPPGTPPAAGDFANLRTLEPSTAAPGPGMQQPVSPPMYGSAWAPLPYTPGPPQWGPVYTHVAPPTTRALRVGLWLAIGAATLEGLVIVVLAIALIARSTSPAPIGTAVGPSGSFVENMGQVVYSSNFGANEA